MKYFVSYTTRDKEITEELLSNFADYLNKYGIAFIDLIDNDSTDKQKRVISELDCSDVLILIESKSIYQSEWVQKELDRAKKKNIPLVKLPVHQVISIRDMMYAK